MTDQWTKARAGAAKAIMHAPLSDFVAQVDAALSALREHGYACVPIEPTKEIALAVENDPEAKRAFMFLWNCADTESVRSGMFRHFIKQVLLATITAAEKERE